ncbi:hypothetical protein BP6252_08085 [Coleophoma cylindrospora]|uniref:Uncharacterized protein n=1 Tax=Coleophoma cylindrospora TaxID=1849047 RepID=A0A3D8RBV8_9HELO|nr:hypothetical protein BP6252_08085 [Coleophoma cylindrospora]
MSLHHIKLGAIPDSDDSSTDTAVTPPENIPLHLNDNYDGASDPGLEPGSTFVIRSLWSREVLTLFKGEVLLAPPGINGSQLWECVETDGWLGFRNMASYAFLGRDDQGFLRCSADWHREWERLRVGERTEGGYILLMTHWWKLRPLGFRRGASGEKRLAMMEIESTDGIVWEFVKV